jgi:putative SOS response-associated peptidase YedK
LVLPGCGTGDARTDGSELEAFTIVIGEPIELAAPIYNRTPVILPSEHHAQWLDPKVQDVETLARLLMHYRADEMRTYPVSTLVNYFRFDTPA